MNSPLTERILQSAHTMGDDFMQIRPMLLLEFGCPPLPVADGKRFETDDPAIINSHDLLSVFMVQMYKQQDSKINRARKEQQEQIAHEYYQNLMQSDGSFESVYGIMATYTRGYMATYLLAPFSINDIRILSSDFISPALKNEINDYRKALRVVHNDDLPEQNITAVQDHIRECRRILCQKRDPVTDQPDISAPPSYAEIAEENLRNDHDGTPIPQPDGTT